MNPGKADANKGMNDPTLQASDIKLWQRLLLVALTGAVPLFIVALVSLRISYRGGVEFSRQELRGNAFERPLEQLLDLTPQYQAATRRPGTESSLASLRRQIDGAMAALATNCNGPM